MTKKLKKQTPSKDSSSDASSSYASMHKIPVLLLNVSYQDYKITYEHF